MRKQQAGFTTVKILLFLLLVAVIGVAAWRIYKEGEKEVSGGSSQLQEIEASTNN